MRQVHPVQKERAGLSLPEAVFLPGEDYLLAELLFLPDFPVLLRYQGQVSGRQTQFLHLPELLPQKKAFQEKFLL